MKTVILLSALCHFAFPVKHSLKYIYIASSGVPNFPEFVGVAVVNENLVVYCDSNTKKLELKQDWMHQYFESHPQQLEQYITECVANQPNYFKATVHSLKERFNQSDGVHILQRVSGCEWDDETGEVNGFNQYGYNGEDFISFDLKTSTWVASKPQAVITKLRWDAETARIKFNEFYLGEIFPAWLKKYMNFGNKSLLRTDLPSVSLLQKTPSSPVTCHATGFYPDRALMFWRKDGEELHEDVDHGEILPNHDGSFQMSVELDITSVSPEDWTKYDCVFHFSGVKDLIVTKLDKAAIRTNWVKPSDTTTHIIAAVGVLALVLVAASGLILYKRKKAPDDDGSETSERLKPET